MIGDRMSCELTVAAVQTSPRLGDIAANRCQLFEGARAAAAAGAELVLFPECQLSGYAFSDAEAARASAESVPGPTSDGLADVCRTLGIEVAFGLLERAGDRLYNTAVLVGSEGIVGRYRKTHLPRIGADRFVAAGDEPYVVLARRDWRLGLSICYDARFPEMHRALALLGADVILLATCWPTGSEIVAEAFVPVRAAENRVFVLVAGRVGEENGTRYIGGSRIAAPDGTVVAAAPLGSMAGTSLVSATIERARSRDKGVGPRGQSRSDVFIDRRPELYVPLVDARIHVEREFALTR